MTDLRSAEDIAKAQLAAFEAQTTALRSEFDAQITKLSKFAGMVSTHTASASAISTASAPVSQATFVQSGVSGATIATAQQIKGYAAQLFDVNALAEKALQDYFDGKKDIDTLNQQFKDIYGSTFDLKQQINKSPSI